MNAELRVVENPRLAQALALAAFGIRVYPKYADNDAAHIRDLVERASHDATTIKQWADRWPDAVFASVMGSGFLCIDVDMKEGLDGRATLREMERQLGPLPPTLTDRTRNGGDHLIFRVRDDSTIGMMDDFAHGIDIKGVDSCVFNYTFDDLTVEPAPLPEVWAAHFSRGRPSGTRRNGKVGPGSRHATLKTAVVRMRKSGIHGDQLAVETDRVNGSFDPPLPDDEVAKLRKWGNSDRVHGPDYKLSDLGNSERFYDEHGRDLHFVIENQMWVDWQPPRWVVDKGHHRTLVKIFGTARRAHLQAVTGNASGKEQEWGRRSEGERSLKAALSLTQSQPGIAISAAQFDADPWLLGVENGVVDLRAGRMIENSREHLITKNTGVAFDAEATCPVFNKFLERVAPSAEVRTFLQSYLGYALTGDTREQCLAILYGSGSNGKSTLIEAVKHVMGDYAIQTLTSTWLVKRSGGIPNDIAGLAGRRLAIASEFEVGAQMATSLVKAASGQETMTGRFLYGQLFEFVPQFKILMSTNHKPEIDGDDFALMRRLRIVPFEVRIPDSEKDKRLRNKLCAEASGILNWLIAGCLAWQREGLAVPAEVEAATNVYAEENSPIHQFVVECCHSHLCEPECDHKEFEKERPKKPFGLMHGSSGVHAAYTSWQNKYRKPGLSKAELKKSLQAAGFQYDRKEKGMFVIGLCLTEEVLRDEF